MTRRARALGIHKFKWFIEHREKFQSLLLGRILALETGLEPLPVDQIVKIFRSGDHTIHRGGSAAYTNQKGEVRVYKPKYSSETKIRKMIRDLDTAVTGGKNGVTE